MRCMQKNHLNHFFNLLEGADWKPLLIAPASVLFVYFAVRMGWGAIVAKPLLETIALVLTGSAFAVYGFRTITETNPLAKVMCVFSFAFFCREIHFPGTSTGIYIAVMGIAIWAWFLRKKLAKPFNTGRFKTWFFAMGWTYFLALLIQRRAFKHLFPLPEFLALEQELHIATEEFLENIAHALLLATAFCRIPEFRKQNNPET